MKNGKQDIIKDLKGCIAEVKETICYLENNPEDDNYELGEEEETLDNSKAALDFLLSLPTTSYLKKSNFWDESEICSIAFEETVGSEYDAILVLGGLKLKLFKHCHVNSLDRFKQRWSVEEMEFKKISDAATTVQKWWKKSKRYH